VPYLEEGNGVCERRVECPAGADVILCAVEGGGHSWPGGPPRQDPGDCRGDGPQSTTFPASRILWQFFSEHPMIDSKARP
jgi:polyhydroxybutyrate depolymerase